MKIHKYNEMNRWLTRPKDTLSKEEKKEVVKDFYKKAEQPKSKPMPVLDYIKKVNFLYGNGDDPKEIDPKEMEDIKKALPVSEMVKKDKKKIIKKEIKVVKKPRPTIQEQLDFQDHLNELDPYWWIDDEEPKEKVLVREPQKMAKGIETILNLHKRKI